MLALTVVVWVVQQDYDIVGVLDQLCLSLFSSYSSDVCRAAALDALHAVAEAMQLKASDLVGERLKEPHIALPSLTFFYRTSSSSVRLSFLCSHSCWSLVPQGSEGMLLFWCLSKCSCLLVMVLIIPMLRLPVALRALSLIHI